VCGIAGILSPGKPPDAAVLTRMLEAQRHRGPDGQGILLSPPLALGAVRLAVRDAGGASAQPLSSADGRFALAYNGELYNDADLRRELEGEGWRFRSRGDAEVVLAALALKGEAALRSFNGVFALAFWDARQGRLILARDRMGLRPLYRAESGGDLLFASEIKGLLASGRIRAALDGPALAELFTFQNIWSPRTLFAGILPVAPGEVLVAEGGHLVSRGGWRPVFSGSSRLSEADAVEGLRVRLGAAVERQLAAEVPVGLALSGGLDSAAVAWESSRLRPGIPAFTVGFEGISASRSGERAVDEGPVARELAKSLALPLHKIRLGPEEAVRDLQELIRTLEEPRLAASFQNLAAARLARRHVTVVLSGGGGDELFGGYPWRYAPILVGAKDPETFRKAFLAVWARVLKPSQQASFWTGEGLRLVGQGDPEGVLGDLSAGLDDLPPLHRAMTIEAATFLPAYCLLEDRLHMAEGVEVRAPLLDLPLVDWALDLPEGLRLAADGSGKRLLKGAMAGRLPAAILAAPKQGFIPPLLTWASSEPWSGLMRSVLLGEKCRARGLFRPEAVRYDVEALIGGDPRPLHRVWTCLAFELWCREFLD